VVDREAGQPAARSTPPAPSTHAPWPGRACLCVSVRICVRVPVPTGVSAVCASSYLDTPS